MTGTKIFVSTDDGNKTLVTDATFPAQVAPNGTVRGDDDTLLKRGRGCSSKRIFIQSDPS